MSGEFDPEDKFSWYFGPMSREETNEILTSARDSGVFLVRESQSIQGDFVLCVKEDSKISHYIINKIAVGGVSKFRIGDQEFADIPSLLNFYKTHYLDTTSLIRPAPREKIVAKYDFAGRDPDDLPFKKGEVLEVMSKDEDKWWTARNSRGQTGSIPVPYVQKYDPDNQPRSDAPQTKPSEYRHPEISPISQITLPARAVVILQRIPSMYDRTQLRLEVGDIVMVTKMNANGQWEGEINGRRGVFPFTHIKFLDNNNPDNGESDK